MFWFVRIVIFGVLIFLLTLGLGYLLPAERSSSTTTLIEADPARVFAIITNFEHQPAWRTDVRSIQANQKGELSAWTEEQTSGLSIRFQETTKTPTSRYIVSFESANGVRGTWDAAFEASSEDRTKLTVNETFIIDNPLRRVAAYVLLNLNTNMDTFLGDLNRFALKKDPGETPHVTPAKVPVP